MKNGATRWPNSAARRSGRVTNAARSRNQCLFALGRVPNLSSGTHAGKHLRCEETLVFFMVLPFLVEIQTITTRLLQWTFAPLNTFKPGIGNTRLLCLS